MKSLLNTALFRLVILLSLTPFVLVNADAQGTKEKQDEKLVKVEAIKVCMVNDRLFEKDQIPVKVEGRTYYGCCKMCEKALIEREEFRTALDPITGNKVDKAEAVIGALPDGTTLYFENENNLRSYGTGEENEK